MQYEFETLNMYGVSSYNYSGNLADKLSRLLSRHIETSHRKLGNVEVKFDNDLFYIKCNECGEFHPVFFEDFLSKYRKYTSGTEIPNHTHVVGDIKLGYDANHILTACCDHCLSHYHIIRCPICSTFYRNDAYMPHTQIELGYYPNSRYGGYTIHGYDDDDNYDTYYHCCQNCRDKRLIDEDTPYQYDTCENCGDIFLSDDMYWCDNDDCYYCEDCYNERLAEIEAEEEQYNNYDDEWHEVEAINDYHGGNHSQRDLGDALMFGAEYEIKCFDLYDDTYDRERFCDGLAKHGSITRDASVDLEIVTKPMTLPDLRQNILDLAAFCAENHVQAWNGGYCGLHIHINRGGISNFTNIYHFLSDNKEKLHLLSGREFTSSATHYCQFDFPAADNELLEECNRYTRYLAVNLENEKTIEFRFFRNTTKKERLEAYFDFLKVLFENDNDLDKMTWEDLIRKTDNAFLFNMFNIEG